MQNYLCPSCGFVEDTQIIEAQETYPVGGEPITVSVKVRACAVCGEWIGDDELDDVAQDLAFQVYRERYDLISPRELVALREEFGLSQRSFAALLGWGESTIHRYELGSLPDDGHNRFLRFLQEPGEMKRYVLKYLHTLPAKVQSTVRAAIEKRESDHLVREAVQKMRQKDWTGALDTKWDPTVSLEGDMKEQVNALLLQNSMNTMQKADKSNREVEAANSGTGTYALAA